MLIKQSPEDFIVEEIPIFKEEELKGSGDYAIYKLTKRNYNTESAVEYICRKYSIQRKNIKYSGTKDKNALTTQYISIFKDKGKLVIQTKDIILKFVGFMNEPLSLGSLSGNRFKITLRDIKKRELSIDKIPNYFDEQRFSKNNLDIGLSILKKDFRKASELIDKESVKTYLKKQPTDFIGAIRTVPLKILTMYIHSVQSYIFNEILSKMIRESKKIKDSDKNLNNLNNAITASVDQNISDYIDEKIVKYSIGEFIFRENYKLPKSIPLIGFDTLPNDTIANILEVIKVKPTDFIIRAIPELSVEESVRTCIVKVENFSYSFKDDACILEFTLPKGSYATIVIKALF